MSDFDAIALAAWQDTKSPLDRLYDGLVGEGNWEPRPPAATYRIYDRETGRL